MANIALSQTENRRLMLLTLILFGAYLCVAISLPIISVFVTGQLGLNNTLAGLAVGITFSHQSSHAVMQGVWQTA